MLWLIAALAVSYYTISFTDATLETQDLRTMFHS